MLPNDCVPPIVVKGGLGKGRITEDKSWCQISPPTGPSQGVRVCGVTTHDGPSCPDDISDSLVEGNILSPVIFRFDGVADGAGLTAVVAATNLLLSV
ncbi:hypothetical protein HAX54_010206 [Datura stramonium]|uniref:Uncharacterized protein n=1 Tax=Datura stramonium TaxID=4076 RepID=A0ABS8TIJ9_DATST|nr:hypothetical protein [Datura stramonium]